MSMLKLEGDFDAIDPFLDAVAQWQQDYIKLDDSPFSARFEQYVSSDFHIGRVQLAGHVLQTGIPVPGCVSFALYDDDLPGTFIRGRELVGDNFGLAAEGEQGALHFTQWADMLIFTIPVQAVSAFYGREIDVAQLRLSAQDRRRVFGELVTAMPSFPEQSAEAVKQRCIETVFGAMTLEAEAKEINEEWDYHHDLVLQFIKGATDSSMGLSDLIAKLGINRRRLTVHVSDTYGLTLVKFLKLIRINRARRQIHERGDQASVAEIAYDAGLPHAGRFSNEFEVVFAELPSRAVERVKNRPKT